MPAQRVRLAGPFRNRQRNRMRLGIIDRRLQRVGIVRRPIAHRAKLLHASLILLRDSRSQIRHINPIHIRESIRPRISRRNLHRPIRPRSTHRLLKRRLRTHRLRRLHSIHRRRRQRPRHISPGERYRQRKAFIHVMLVRRL